MRCERGAWVIKPFKPGGGEPGRPTPPGSKLKAAPAAPGGPPGPGPARLGQGKGAGGPGIGSQPFPFPFPAHPSPALSSPCLPFPPFLCQSLAYRHVRAIHFHLRHSCAFCLLHAAGLPRRLDILQLLLRTSLWLEL